MYEQGLKRMIEVLLVPDIDVVKCDYCLEHGSGRHVQSNISEQSTKQDQIGQKVARIRNR